MRPIIDAHLDLSWSALQWSRDLTQPLDAVRAAEAHMTDHRGRGRGTVTRTRRTWLAPAAGGLALAAAVLLAVLPKGSEAPGTRRKGGERIGFFVKRGEVVTRGQTGEHVRPGDSLRFTYTSSEPRHLAILSLDGAQHASVYFPSGGRAEPLPAGVRKVPTMTTSRISARAGTTMVACPKAKVMTAAPRRNAFIIPPPPCPCRQPASFPSP